jgi:uncharacterized protein (TIGR04255 family)
VTVKKMPDFAPFSEDHAIQTVSFALIVDKPLQPLTIEEVRKNHDQWRDELPAIQIPPTFQVDLAGPAPVQRPTLSNAVIFSFLRPDGTPAWVFRFMGLEIAVECLRYTRWDRVWETTKRYLQLALKIVNTMEPDRTITATGLQVVDKFRAIVNPYNINHLFKPNKYIPPVLIEAGGQWHNHSGWFEQQSGNHMFWLQNLNVQSLHEGTDHVFVVTHVQQFRYPTPSPVAYWSQSAGELDECMRRMHVANKTVLKSLLSDEMAFRIGLEGKP